MISILKSFLPACENCDTPSVQLFCEHCLTDLKPQNMCLVCGKFPIADSIARCAPCSSQEKPWDNLSIAFFYQGGVRSWILDIKDGGKPERLRELKREHLAELQTRRYDGVVAVSTDPQAIRRRGYDHGSLLARRVAKLLNLRPLEGVFEHRPFLNSQKTLDVNERRQYLGQIVSLSEAARALDFNRLLLVDDVMTSGASIEVHTAVLKKISSFVDVFCLSRAPKSH